MKKNLLLFIFNLLVITLLAQVNTDKYAKVKIFAKTPEQIATLLQKGVCLENLEFRKDTYLIGEFSPFELQQIRESNIPFEIIEEDMTTVYLQRNKGYSIDSLNKEMQKNRLKKNGAKTPVNFHLGTFAGYHNLDEIYTELDEMRALFPNLISEKLPFAQQTIGGRNIYWVRISNNPNLDQEKPRVLFTSLTHAREPAGMQQLIYQMWDLLENYGTDPEITYYIDNLEIYFIPCVCPDGYEHNKLINPYGGGMWRKNRRNNGDGTFGVDLNRNWGYEWGYDNTGSSPNGSAETYRGIAPFSEVETQVLKTFLEQTKISVSLNNHTYGNYLIYPYGYSNAVPVEYPVFKAYAERLTSENHYAYGNCFQVLNYYSNGGSEDWFYGEQTTKDKIFGFTPEAGLASEGFWPPVHRIEEICKGHVTMNKYVMRFALPYAEIIDETPINLHQLQNEFPFTIIALGNVESSNFEVFIEPVSDNILMVTSGVSFQNMSLLDKSSSFLSMELKPNILYGDEVVFDICINNGEFTHKQRITKIYGVLDILLTDNCETMDNWSSTTWGTSSAHYVSPSKSIADSPVGSYPNYANRTIYSVNSYDLTDVISASVEFSARWDIEAGYDYVQFLVSDNNGATWVPQTGKFTKLGNSNQDVGKPLYDAIQNSWVRESINLNAYKDKTIKLGFRLISDSYTVGDGFYFDDFVLQVMKPQLLPTVNFPDTISFLCTEESYIVNVLDYVYYSNNEEIEVHWEGNENIEINYDHDLQTLTFVPNEWFGNENVTFVVSNSNGEVSQEVVLQSINNLTIENMKKDYFNVYYQSHTHSIKCNFNENSLPNSLSVFDIYGKIISIYKVHSNIQTFKLPQISSSVYFVKTDKEIAKKVLVY